MEKSDKFSLFLPDDSDIIEISKLSYNFEKIDNVLSLIMVILGYGGEITYEVNNIDIGKPSANDTSLHDENMYIAQIDVAFNSEGVRIPLPLFFANTLARLVSISAIIGPRPYSSS